MREEGEDVPDEGEGEEVLRVVSFVGLCWGGMGWGWGEDWVVGERGRYGVGKVDGGRLVNEGEPWRRR